MTGHILSYCVLEVEEDGSHDHAATDAQHARQHARSDRRHGQQRAGACGPRDVPLRKRIPESDLALVPAVVAPCAKCKSVESASN